MESSADKTSCGSGGTDGDVQQIKTWLHEVLGQDAEFETDDKTIAALKVLMKIQGAAKKDTLEEISESQELSTTFIAKAEMLERGLEAGNISPGKLPEDVSAALETLAKVGVDLGCQDGCPKRMEEAAVRLEKRHKELLEDKQQLKKDVAAFEELIDSVTQRLSRTRVQGKQMTSKAEKAELDAIKKQELRNREKLETMQERDIAVPDSLDPAQLVTKAQELERLVAEKQELEEKLKPMQGLPPDVEVIRAKVATMKKTAAALSDTLEKKLQKDHGNAQDVAACDLVKGNKGGGEV